MSLTVASLAAHGFAPEVLAIWERELGGELRAVQEEAVRTTGLLRGESLAVSAPTAAGKTLLGELAAVRAIERGRSAAWLVPTRALAEEVVTLLRRRYAPLGLRIVCSTREHTENDAEIGAGRFDWLVGVYEKFNALLVSRPGLLGQIGVVVVDELAMLGDRERGPELELLLTKLRRGGAGFAGSVGATAGMGRGGATGSGGIAGALGAAGVYPVVGARGAGACGPVQIVALGFPPARGFETVVGPWLGAQWLQVGRRPADLIEAVVDLETMQAHWHSTNTRAGGIVPLAALFSGEDPPGWLGCGDVSAAQGSVGATAPPRLDADPADDHRAALCGLARWVATQRGEQVIVFVPTRRTSVRWARDLAGLLRKDLDAPETLLARIDAEEPGRGTRLLRECLEARVGFHNSDLPAPLRRLVERAYRAGEIRVLVSTPTLAVGVNLGGRTVLQVARMVDDDDASGRMTQRRLSRERFRGQGGRAARQTRRESDRGGALRLPGDAGAGGGAGGGEWGRSLVVASNDAEARRLAANLLPQEAEPPTWPLERADWAPLLLDLLAGGFARSVGDLRAILLDTRTGRDCWRRDDRAIDARIDEALGRLESVGLVQRLGFGAEGIVLGGFAQAVASAALPIDAAALVIEWLKQRPGRPGGGGVDALEALLVVALCPAMKGHWPPARGAASDPGSVLEEVLRRLGISVGESGAGDRVWASLAWLWARVQPCVGMQERERRAVVLALLLDDWMGEGPTEEIEARYGVLGGAIGAAGAQAAWILRAAASLAEAMGLARVPPRLRELASCLEPGVAPEGLPWVRAELPGVGRMTIRALLREGIRSPEAARELAPADLRRVLGNEAIRCLLGGQAEAGGGAVAAGSGEHAAGMAVRAGDAREAEPAGGSVSDSEALAAPGEEPPDAGHGASESRGARDTRGDTGGDTPGGADLLLRIDESDVGGVWVCGERVRLSPKPRGLLLELARTPGICRSYRSLMQTVWEGGIVEQQQIGAHRKAVVKALAAVLGSRRAEELIVVEFGSGLRLSLTPEQVRVEGARESARV